MILLEVMFLGLRETGEALKLVSDLLLPLLPELTMNTSSRCCFLRCDFGVLG